MYLCVFFLCKEEERIALTDCDDLENNRKQSAETDGDDDTFERYPADRKPGIKIRNLRKTFKTEAGECFCDILNYPR